MACGDLHLSTQITIEYRPHDLRGMALSRSAINRGESMAKPQIITRVLGGDQLECRIVSPHWMELVLTGSTDEVEPSVIQGSEVLARNQALINNAWAYAKFTHLGVSLPTRQEQERAEKTADSYLKIAEWLADLSDDPVVSTKPGWCSSCFSYSEHQKLDRPRGNLPAYLCVSCGSATLPCADLRCPNMAIRERGVLRVPKYCAEHSHSITGFEKANHKMETLEEYKEFLTYDKTNLSRNTKLVGGGAVGLAAAIPAALLAAPAIGGAIGVALTQYSGAAAMSYGLAFLGGGSVASGGLGMLGGTYVIATVGGLLGTSVSASVTNAYVREDKSFRIEFIRDGKGAPVLLCNGFLSEGVEGWGEWKPMVNERYPDAPVYRIQWGAKELKDLGILASGSAIKAASAMTIKAAASSATKAGARLIGPLSPILVGAGLAKNPWHVAKNRADKTGVVLADLLARTKQDSFILIGHSLGARVMVVAAEALSTKIDGPKIEAVHLTGAAIGSEGEWGPLVSRVEESVFNYHSQNDLVLKYLYGSVSPGNKAAGLVGFQAPPPKLVNVDVTSSVNGHSEYLDNVTLRQY